MDATHGRRRKGAPRIAIGFILAAWGTLAAVGCGGEPRQEATAGRGETSASGDARTVVEMPAPAREAVLAEMRAMLEALNGVLAAAADGDREAMAEAARGGGTAIAVDTDPAVARSLPREFVQLGSGTHHAFDSLAAEVEAGVPVDTVLQRLGALTGKCVACHATYRVTAGEGRP